MNLLADAAVASRLDRRVLVTGAESGIGHATARLLAAAGAEVVCSVFNAALGPRSVDPIHAAGGRASWVACDVRRPDDVAAAVAATVERLGGLDVLIHAATSPLSAEQKTLDKLDADFWEQVVSTNLRAAFRFARAAYPHLKASSGTLILVTSAAGIEGASVLPEYGATKAATRGLAKSLAQEWGPEGITVNCLSPAALTPAYQRTLEQDPAWAEHIRRAVPLGRLGDPLEDIAPALLFLASPAARYMTGQTLVVTGGRTLLL